MSANEEAHKEVVKNEAVEKEQDSLSQEVFDEVKAESKGVLKGLVDDIFGDFRKFLSILTTTGYWFFLPLAINSKEHQDPKSRFMNDLQLAKSLFFLMIIFLVLDKTLESDEAEIEQWATQFAFLLFYCVFLVLFMAIGHGWRVLANPSVDDQREFSAHLLYQACTLNFIQAMLYGYFDLRVTVAGGGQDETEFIPLGFFLVVGIPYIHTLYFFYRLNRRYKAENKILGSLYIAVVMAFLLLMVSASNELFLSDGFAETS